MNLAADHLAELFQALEFAMLELKTKLLANLLAVAMKSRG